MNIHIPVCSDHDLGRVKETASDSSLGSVLEGAMVGVVVVQITSRACNLSGFPLPENQTRATEANQESTPSNKIS